MPPYTLNYTHTHTQRVRICCHNTDFVHVNGHDRIILVIFSQALYKAPWWWILFDPKHVWSTFKYFIILIVSTYYILCISWIIKCLIDKGCRLCVTPSENSGIKFRVICVIAIKDEDWLRFRIVVFLIVWWLRASAKGRHVSCQALQCVPFWTPVTYLLNGNQWHHISLSCVWRNATQFQEACQITGAYCSHCVVRGDISWRCIAFCFVLS